MGRHRRNNNFENVLYVVGVILILTVLGYIVEHAIQALITCAIVGVTIGIVALLRHLGIMKPGTLELQKKTYIQSHTEAASNQKDRNNTASETSAPNINYRKKSLLTNHERTFYYSLAPIAKKYNLCVLSKIRIADLVEPTAHAYKERSDYFHFFGKIKAKHIDFALCDPADLEVKLLIELDDWTHGTAKGRERDEFVEEVYKDTGYRLLRVYDPRNLETKICEALEIREIFNEKENFAEKHTLEESIEGPVEEPAEEALEEFNEPIIEETTENAEEPIEETKGTKTPLKIPITTKIAIGSISLIILGTIMIAIATISR